MTFIYTWNATFLATPADTDDESQGAQRIRDTKAAVGERFAIDHSLLGDANDGKHISVTLKNRGTAGAAPIGGTDGFLFANQANGITELYYQNSSAQVVQITSAGAIDLLPSGTQMLFYSVPPPGWTLNTGINDYTVRIVNFTGGGAGGSWLITGGSVLGHSLTAGELPQHQHTEVADNQNGSPGPSPVLLFGFGNLGDLTPVGNNFTDGGLGLFDQPHTHGLSFDGSWRPLYLNMVLGIKN